MKPVTHFLKYYLLQTLCYCLLTLNALAQKTHTPLDLNLDFEQVNKGIPLNWSLSLNNKYESKIDSINVKQGKYSISIKHKEGSGGFGLFSLTIPLSYPGKKITLSGYMKTENVEDGFAGLMLRLDPQVAFDNMNKKSIKGTTDWTKYEITLDLDPEKTTATTIGGILVGKGKVWMDNLTVQIDGKNISTLTPILKKTYPAESDHEFDSTSKIIPFALDKNKTKDLQDLGLIWGFLKYYHPQIAAGNHNWDYALFRILPQVIASPSQQIRDQILTTWIKSLGDFEIDSLLTSAGTEDIKIVPDLDWIQTSGFSQNLQKELLRVKKAKRKGDHFYISQNPTVGNPVIKNENPYRNISMTDVGYRILSLYRYWNLIQYYFPYKNLIDQDWKEVLHDYIPKMIAADDVQAYTLTTLQLIGNIHDTHANISGNSVLNNFKGTRYAPLEITFIENKAVITGFHDQQKGVQTGLKIGDVLTTINGIAVDQIIRAKLKYYPASNYSTQLRDIANDLLRTNDTLVQIGYLQDHKIANQTIKTYSTDEINIYKKYQLKDVSIRMISPEIAYINNGKLNRTSLPQVIEQLKNTKGMIIDCRNYPSDIPMIYEFAKYLLPKATSFTKFTAGSLTTPGEFTFINDIYVGIKNDDYYKGKIMILVNETTQSASEFYAMAYSIHPNAQVVGSTTAGADGNTSSFFLPGGINTAFSGVGVYYPNKTETQRVGIKIDIESAPTIKGVKAGKDEVLEKALYLLKQ
ncbi:MULTISPECIES: S41 family peptidase [unclassified Sphingobacterium]|uniref:S41 family peptidase n=1 Tax=unclassified Sphingobacterium TaxID=2609468 RepID=UPI00104E51FB|nr:MULTISPECIES: S41 family peptidase [unclassified Sphingobacterium]MCS3554963.1 hypothetical protein [Sphingobacterium sp. JUb21]TCR05640.1 peptidase S41-like protein [Sphingobacterium sp. JUb20]